MRGRALAALAMGAALLLGCGEGAVTRLDPVPKRPAATLGTTDDGKPVLLVREGSLPELRGKRLDLPPGEATFLVFHDGEGEEQQDGDEPRRASLWLRGAGDRRHTLPSAVSPQVEVGASDDWTMTLLPGSYELSLTMGARGEQAPVPVLVR